MQTIHRIKRIIINKVLPLSLCPLLFTSCSVPKQSELPQSSETLLETTPPQFVPEETESTSEEITKITEAETEREHFSHVDTKVTFDGDTSRDEITQADFKNCKEALEADGMFLMPDNWITVYDIDYDGKDEIIALYGYYFFIFEKSGGEITERYRIQAVLSETGCIDSLDLKTYSDGEEKYPYFTFHYDNNMVCDVLAAFKYDKEADNYSYEYIISWGKIEYGGDAAQFNHAFFRKG